ncbi:hypothetical protein WBP07_11685 [Novosphingobium sp. BL-8A]|uniref:hypothetical protein n=1 Tax=Novosphingobium sp. BL-8A TaxID=3127639 RepID=UPI003757A481
MKILAHVTLFVAILTCTAPVYAKTHASSSAEDRQRFVNVTENLERTPLNPALTQDRQWALRWLVEAPDVSVSACLTPFAKLPESYAHSSEIIVQYMLAMAAFTIRHPEQSTDAEAQQLAGVESALNMYQSILRAQPEEKSPALDNILNTRDKGELKNFIHTAYAECSKNEGKRASL